MVEHKYHVALLLSLVEFESVVERIVNMLEWHVSPCDLVSCALVKNYDFALEVGHIRYLKCT